MLVVQRARAIWAVSRINLSGAWILTMVLAFAAGPARAQPVSFNIPAEDAAAAIRQFAQQSGLQVIASADTVKGVTTRSVVGSMSPEAALHAVLEGSGLGYRRVSDTTIAIVASNAGAGGHAGDGTLRFNIPAGELPAALKTFSEQAHLTLKYSHALVRGKSTQGISGSYAPADALRMLLTGTGIAATAISGSSYVLKALPKAKSAAVGPNPETTEHVLVAAPQEKPFSGMNADIPRTIDDVQPYYIFDSETIEQSGATNIEDFLKQRLTMNTVSETNSQVTSGATSTTRFGALAGNTSTINLRGLGTNETLILVDGRRMAGVNLNSGNTGLQQPDINGIPLAAIDRIEILPSSASGIYGGSAVGGVINIILKKDYTGGDVRVSYDRPTSGDAPISTLTATYGTTFEDGKSHVMVTGQYSDSQPLTVGDRVDLIDRGYTTLLANNPSFLGYDPTFSTLQSPLWGATPNIIGYSTSTYLPVNLTLKSTGAALNCPDATLPVGYSTTSSPSTIIACRWNLALPDVNQSPTGLLTPLGSNPKVESLTATFTRQMSERIEFFADGLVASNKSFQEVGENSTEAVSSTSPFNPFNQSVLVTFPDDFTAPATVTSTTYTATVGFKVDLSHHWTSEMDYTWSKNTFDNIQYSPDETLMTDFLNGPLNPFVDTLAHPLDLSRYLTFQPFSGSSTVDDMALRATGPLGSLPWGDPQLTLGLEHRKENTPEATDPSTDPQSAADSYNVIEFPQSQSVDSLYVEGTIPLVTSKNAIPGVSSLELQLADRIERFSVSAGSDDEFIHTSPPSIEIFPTPPNANANGTGGTPLQSTTTYSSNNETIGLKYKPVNDVTIRASHATAFLPPTPNQLLLDPVVNVNGDTITDPKTGATYQVNTITGGNASLKPQTSQNWDLGLIYEPKEEVLSGLRVNLEYYKIDQFNYITSITGNQILADPALTATRVTRSPTTGLITLINESYINATEFETDGFDLAFDYHKPTSVGTFYLHAAATRMEHNLQQYTIGVPAYELAGAPLADGGAAKWKGNGALNWAYRNWTLGWTVTWYGTYPQAGYPGDPFGASTYYTMAQGSYYIPSQFYHDVFASYSFDPDSGGSRIKSAITKGLTVELGIKNVFNTLPPFDAYFAPFYASPYGDLRLRDVWLTVKKAF
jgi:iron complex outermembrane recepter protein